MGRCTICRDSSALIADELGLCLECIRHHPNQVLEVAADAHGRIRHQWGVPARVPDSKDGIQCDICTNRCRMADGQWGYCGLRQNVGGRMEGVSAEKGKLSWYHDPLPTNCVGDWVCPGGTGCGYPTHAYTSGPEHGYENLAVFPYACTFHCLYCQNWHFRHHTLDEKYVSVEALARAVHDKTACICYFGGDPSSQLPYLLRASQQARKRHQNRILRICWETNGAVSKRWRRPMLDSALESGGCIKIDLKAWDENLHLALTGVSNRQTLENFKWFADQAAARQQPPLLIASTLLVPGYIDASEVFQIAKFIASLNPDIPYSLLGFHPDYRMMDLSATSKQHAKECLHAAQQAGVRRINVGNMHLLK